MRWSRGSARWQVRLEPDQLRRQGRLPRGGSAARSRPSRRRADAHHRRPGVLRRDRARRAPDQTRAPRRLRARDVPAGAPGGAAVTRLVLYVAHPVAPNAEEIAKRMPGSNDVALRDATRGGVQANLAEAMKWVSWLRRSFPGTTFIAPWIVGPMSGEDDTDPAARERGLVDCCAVVERCDGIVLVGPRISSGMARERDHGMQRFKIWVDPADQPPTFQVYDLTGVFQESIIHSKWAHSERGTGTCRITFVEWAEIFLG